MALPDGLPPDDEVQVEVVDGGVEVGVVEVLDPQVGVLESVLGVPDVLPGGVPLGLFCGGNPVGVTDGPPVATGGKSVVLGRSPGLAGGAELAVAGTGLSGTCATPLR
ncbi:hypothetical protein [Amycolatopsis sp. Poz14]|uniref:hypothetical protein n=1 Tax=Amycolatopsis sp. Poz14 TaxID=1447705 RepID=UPI0027E166EC|nr:hypothetical protein [Amycolatopsis sp. Poz14]